MTSKKRAKLTPGAFFTSLLVMKRAYVKDRAAASFRSFGDGFRKLQLATFGESITGIQAVHQEKPDEVKCSSAVDTQNILRAACLGRLKGSEGLILAKAFGYEGFHCLRFIYASFRPSLSHSLSSFPPSSYSLPSFISSILCLRNEARLADHVRITSNHFLALYVCMFVTPM